MQELPTMCSGHYGINVTGLTNLGMRGTPKPRVPVRVSAGISGAEDLNLNELLVCSTPFEPQQQQTKTETMKRIARVIISDPNENVPLDETVLHDSGEKRTESTNEELFFEANPHELLEEHNKKRITWKDKKESKGAKEPIMLEPAKIRDLKMVVIDIASLS